jgi:integrase/recombinase XerC
MFEHILREFEVDMRLAGLSPKTICARLEVVRRLGKFLSPKLPRAATEADLGQFQRQFAALAPASIDIYVRHVQAFYRWLLMRGRINTDPSTNMIRPKLRRGRPHPTSMEDMQRIFACTNGHLRLVYALAAFAGARCGEISRLQRQDISLIGTCPTARLDGKGGKVRIVPLVEPIIAELQIFGLPRSGWIVTRDDGAPYTPDKLSLAANRQLRRIGVEDTLHSLRHSFATTVYQSSRDLLLVKELLGHESVATTQIYAEPDMISAHERLQAVSSIASSLLNCGRLRAV